MDEINKEEIKVSTENEQVDQNLNLNKENQAKVEELRKQNQDQNFTKINKTLDRVNRNMKFVFWIVVALVIAFLVYRSITSGLGNNGEVIETLENITDTMSNGESESGTSYVLAAVVNGEKLTLDQFNKEYELYFFQNNIPDSYKSMLLKKDFLNQSVTKMLLYNEAVKQGYAIELKDAEENLEAMLKVNKMTKLDYSTRLSKEIFDYDFVLEDLRRTLTIVKFLNASIFDGIEVTEEEARKFYEENQEQFMVGDEIRASHILVKSEEEAKDILKKVNEENLAAMADTYSIDPSVKDNHGDLGFFKKGVMVPEFEEAAFALKVGTFSEPIKSQFGYHIIYVSEKKHGYLRSFGVVKAEILNSISSEKQKVAFEEVVGKLRSEAEVETYI